MKNILNMEYFIAKSSLTLQICQAALKRIFFKGLRKKFL